MNFISCSGRKESIPGNNKITNVATPTDAADAANKQYVDNVIASSVVNRSVTINGQIWADENVYVNHYPNGELSILFAHVSNDM